VNIDGGLCRRFKEALLSAASSAARAAKDLRILAMTRWLVLAVEAGILLAAGCAHSANAPRVEHPELGQQFVLAQEPEGAMGILDYREAKPEADDVTLLGRIGGGQPTWSHDSAMFLVTDPTQELADKSDHVCHGDNCPFCKGKVRVDDSRAIVILTGADGRVPPMDARKLMPLAEGQMVVVSGRAEVNSLGQLVVHARGVYVRR
jgi:hypothetical protein